MRQLFVPACLCLMTWSHPTGTDPKLSLEQFYGQIDSERLALARLRDEAAATTTVGKRVEEALPVLVPEEEVAAANAGIAFDETTGGDIVETVGASDAPITVASLPLEAESQWEMPEAVQSAVVPPPPPVAALPVVHRSSEEVCETLAVAARDNDLPAPFFIKLLFQESRFDPAVVSPAGALGIAQFMPGTAEDEGLINPFDPVQAIHASARLLRKLTDAFGNLGLAAAAYNGGPGRVQNWLDRKGKLPAETQGYVKVITGRPAEGWKKRDDETWPDMRLPPRAPCQEAAGLFAWNGPKDIPLPVTSPLRARAEVLIANARDAAGKASGKDDGNSDKATIHVASLEQRQAALAVMKTIVEKDLAARGTGKQVAGEKARGSVQLAASRHKKRTRKTD